MRQKPAGKLYTKAIGPFTFIKYNNSDRLTATISSIEGKKRQCSVANLLPIRTVDAPCRRVVVTGGLDTSEERAEQHVDLDSDSDFEDYWEDDTVRDGFCINKRPRPTTNPAIVPWSQKKRPP